MERRVGSSSALNSSPCISYLPIICKLPLACQRRIRWVRRILAMAFMIASIPVGIGVGPWMALLAYPPPNGFCRYKGRGTRGLCLWRARFEPGLCVVGGAGVAALLVVVSLALHR